MSTGPPLACADPTPRPRAIGVRRVLVSDRPPVLTVTLFPADALDRAPWFLDKRAYSLTGGLRLHPHLLAVRRVAGRADQVELVLDGAGDFNPYTLTVTGPGIDRFFASVEVRFRRACRTPFDCRPRPSLPAAPPPDPVVVDYLAKDYASFRQALVDFVGARMPDWVERSEADLAIALLELIAHTGDMLSYHQDRVGGEAYLETARTRRSVAEHVRLLDYRLDEGASAGTWLQFGVIEPHLLPAGFAVVPQNGDEALTFETASARALRPEHNEMFVYDWGQRGCVLPAGSTRVFVVGAFGALEAGDHVLLADTRTGVADVVRLIEPPLVVPPDPVTAHPTDALTELRWSSLTPLRHDLAVPGAVAHANLVWATHGLTVTEQHRVAGPESDGPPPERALVVPPEGPPGTTFHLAAWGFATRPNPEAVDVAVRAPDGRLVFSGAAVAQDVPGGIGGLPLGLGSNVEEGWWRAEVTGVASGRVARTAWRVVASEEESGDAGGAGAGAARRAPRLRVRLERAPVAVRGDGRPEVQLLVDGDPWQLRRSLLDSGPDDRHVRVEAEEDSGATLVFGRGGEDGGGYGLRPAPGSTLTVVYRVGGGAAGNLPARALTRPVGADPTWFAAVTNPLPASGGRDPETLAHARVTAPASIARRTVAVTHADYERAARQVTSAGGERLVERAGVAVRWTGSWLSVELTPDPAGNRRFDAELAAAVLGSIEPYRLAGYDLAVRAPSYLPVDLWLHLCVAPDMLPADVGRAVEHVLGTGTLPSGGLAFFHHDRFTFGRPLAVSELFAAVVAVEGVVAARILRLAPMHAADPDAVTQAALAAGRLAGSPDQILVLDNDPSLPERGRLTITTEGGR